MGIKLERSRVKLSSRRPRIHRVKPGEQAPNFASLFDPSGIEIPPVPDADEHPTTLAENETSAILETIRREKKMRRDAYRIMTDTNYYTVIVFQCESQRDEFLQKAGWDHLGTKYLDGLAVANLLGIDIVPINLPRTSTRPAPKTLANYEFVLPENKQERR